MKNEKKVNLIKGTLVAGALLSVSALSAMPNSSSLFEYNALGSGAEVRTEILHTAASPFNLEAKCGEKTTTKAESKKAEAKCGEGKCGEGKCGGKDEKEKTKKAESKSKEMKCGEGKCGGKDKKAEAKKAESKSKEMKCGEGKCGVE